MFGELRHLLNMPPDHFAWTSICALVDHICDPDSPDYEPGALEYAQAGAARWPDAARYVDASEATRRAPPHAALARAATLYHDHDAAWLEALWAHIPVIKSLHSDAIGRALDHPALGERLRELEQLEVFSCAAEPTLEVLERWSPALRALNMSWDALEPALIERLLALPSAERWERLELDISLDQEPPDDYEGEWDAWLDEQAGGDAIRLVYEVGRCERLRALRSLTLSCSHQRLRLDELVRGWRARAPEALRLALCTLEPGQLGALRSWGGQLDELELGHVSCDRGELRELLEDEAAWPRLSSLSLSGSYHEAADMLTALGSRALKQLNLTFSAFNETIALRILANSPSRQTLEVLRMGASGLRAVELEAMLSTSWLRLKELSIWQNTIDVAGAAALARPGALDALVQLYMPNNSLGDQGLEVLARGMPSLRDLTASHNFITDEGVAALIRSPLAARLTALDLSENADISASSLSALLDPSSLPALLSLDISRTKLADDGDAQQRLAALRRVRPWVKVRCDPTRQG